MSATPQLPPVAKLEQKTIVDMISRGKRVDDRGIENYRTITIEAGLIEKANGSAEVHLGKSRVLVGVKVQTGPPFPDTPDEGVLTVNAELVPLASPSLRRDLRVKRQLSLRESSTAEYVNRKRWT